MAANRVTQMIDPWPAASGQRNIAYNGEKAAVASERYRTGRVIPPVNATTSSAAYTQAAQQAQSTANTQASSAPNAGGQQQQQPDQVARRRTRAEHAMRMAKSSSATNKTVVAVLTADPAFEQSVRSTFGASGAIELRIVSGTIASVDALRHRRRHRRHRRSRRQPRRGDGGAGADDAPHRRHAAGGRGDAELRRRGGAQPAADAGGGFPGQAGAAGRAGAHLRAGRPLRPRRDQRGADLHLHSRGRRRRRHHAGDPDRAAAAQQRPARPPDRLPGRSRFPARRLRRLSRSRAAAGPEGNRAAAGAARPPASRDHAVAPRLGP